MERRKVLDALAALASETRLDLVRALIVAGEEGLPAGEIGRRLGIAASRLSFHLSALEQAGLVRVRQEPAQFKMREPRDMRVVGEKAGA